MVNNTPSGAKKHCESTKQESRSQAIRHRCPRMVMATPLRYGRFHCIASTIRYAQKRLLKYRASRLQ